MLNNPQNNITPARYLSTKEAAKFCPYGVKKLKKLVADRVVRGGQLKDNKDSWFVDMESLYQHIESQCFKPDRARSKETEQKIVDFVRRMT